MRTHLYDLALLGVNLGHTAAFMWGFALIDMYAEVFAEIAGARTTIAYPVPGGVRRDVKPDHVEAVRRLLEVTRKELKDFKTLFLDDPVTKARLEGVGIVDAKKTAELGVVGPFARASGIDYDARFIPTTHTATWISRLWWRKTATRGRGRLLGGARCTNPCLSWSRS